MLLRWIAIGGAALVAGAGAFFVVSLLLDQPSGPGSAVVVNAETLCEIELGPERCPGLPNFAPAKTSRVFFDTWQDAGTNVDRCMKRAEEFYAACHTRHPVMARFLKGRDLVRARVHP